MGIRSLTAVLFLLIGLAVVPTSAAARYCEHIRSLDFEPPGRLKACLKSTLTNSDAELNDAYQALMKALKAKPDDEATRLKNAQRLWIKYRDANCAWRPSDYGDVDGIESLACIIQMTDERTAELKSLYAIVKGESHSPYDMICGTTLEIVACAARSERIAAIRIPELEKKLIAAMGQDAFAQFEREWRAAVVPRDCEAEAAEFGDGSGAHTARATCNASKTTDYAAALEAKWHEINH